MGLPAGTRTVDSVQPDWPGSVQWCRFGPALVAPVRPGSDCVVNKTVLNVQ